MRKPYIFLEKRFIVVVGGLALLEGVVFFEMGVKAKY